MASKTWLHIAIVFTIAVTIFFTSLGKARLWDRDEPRNAGCTAEMMQRGDLVVPVFNDELRHQKPVLLYWLMMSAYAVFGINEFAARFWSAALAVGTVFFTYGIARRLFDATVALFAAIALSSSIMFCVAARAATPDSSLIFFGTLGIYLYIVGTFVKSGDGSQLQLRHKGHWFPQNSWFVVFMNVAFALGVLTKGPIGIVVPTAIIGMFLLLQLLPEPSTKTSNPGWLSRFCSWFVRLINPIHFFRTCWYMRPLTAIGIVLVIAAPWYILVGLHTDGEFVRLFFVNENFARATMVMESHSGSWLFYYPATIAIGFFPWSIFLGPIVFAVYQHLSTKSEHCTSIRFLVCWVLVQVGMFSVAETKLPSYVTPCYPALAILTAYCVLRWLPSASTGRRWQLACSGTLVLAGIVTAIGLGVATGKYFPEIWWITALGLIPLAGGVISILLLCTEKHQWSNQAIAVSAVLFCLFTFGVGTVAVDSTRQTHTVLNDIRLADEETEIATYHCLESSWVFYAQRPIYELQRGNSNQSQHDNLDRQSFWERKPVVTPESFVLARPESMFLTTDDRTNELLRRLPPGYRIEREVDFFLKPDQKLVLIGRRIPDTAQKEAAPTTVR